VWTALGCEAGIAVMFSAKQHVLYSNEFPNGELFIDNCCAKLCPL
jgi:hypothetical protein